jgi:probable rRNA maturation factor
MKIWFEADYSRKRVHPKSSKADLIRVVRKILTKMKQGRAEVGLILTGDAKIRRLNRSYRKIDRATDVLAFAMQEGPHPLRLGPSRVSGHPRVLGDVVISVETAKRQAREQGHSLDHEIGILIIHGLLHLLGYDHERSLSAARTMRKNEKGLLKAVSGMLG